MVKILERLQKILAEANIASRRKAEEMILQGRVKVNSEVITQLGYKVSLNDSIFVDGKPIERAEKQYFLLNKPRGVLSTTADDESRLTVVKLLTEEHRHIRLYPIGRLDYNTAGLLILTNDGDLTKVLTNPNNRISKEYLIRIDGIMIKEKIRQIRKGIMIENKLIKPLETQLIERDKTNQTTLVRLVIDTHQNKDLMLIFKALGHKIKKITRTRYDFLTLEGVERGKYRALKIHEIKQLHQIKQQIAKKQL